MRSVIFIANMMRYTAFLYIAIKLFSENDFRLNKRDTIVLEAYRKHVAERAAQGVVPQPLNAQQTAALVELIKKPLQGEEAFLIDLLENRIPPGVDEAAYVKAGFWLHWQGERSIHLSSLRNMQLNCLVPCKAAIILSL